ncbi:MAG: hypothetical protein KatS3mg131_0767 [Candidatus Tectimicrobiota bacterium]|nr:MAG: hypothetical protein KatS3mg131_0767 [Candidatus Tectomicrobia bacterium]
MTHALEYLATLLHLLGLLLLAGGHFWFALLTAVAERHGDERGERFLATAVPVFANGFGAGILLLFSSGLLKLLLWREPGLIFLPDVYGWVLFGKLVLYMLIVANGVYIERRCLPAVLQAARQAEPLATSSRWQRLKRHARLNLVLVLVVVALGETLRFSKL